MFHAGLYLDITIFAEPNLRYIISQKLIIEVDSSFGFIISVQKY